MKIAAFLLLILFAVFIPNADGQMTMIGVRGGIDIANQYYENLPDGESISSRILFLGGAQVDYHFTNSFALSLQFLYNQKGSHAEIIITKNNYIDSGGFADWTTSYLEVPILLKVYFGNSIVRPYLFGGSSIGLLLRNTEEVHTASGFTVANGPPGSFTSLDTVANITDSTAKFNFSLVVGAGISVTLASGIELFLDAGYAFGLNNINNYYMDKAKDYYVYSRDIRIAAGILLPLYLY